MYKPNPINTSEIVLPEELVELTDLLAKNVHDVWAVGRISEGWKYGEKKDSEKMETPLLIPYEDLTDDEKAYDRNTSLETLKLIIKLGYQISKK